MTGQDPVRTPSAFACSGPAPPKSDQRKVARVVTLFNRHQAQRAKHRFVDDFDDALSRRHQVDAHRIRNRLHGRLRFFAKMFMAPPSLMSDGR